MVFSKESESSQLLGDSYQPQYGGASSGEGLVGPEPDPEDIKRERDALERLCTQTSELVAHFPTLQKEKVKA